MLPNSALSKVTDRVDLLWAAPSTLAELPGHRLRDLAAANLTFIVRQMSEAEDVDAVRTLASRLLGPEAPADRELRSHLLDLLLDAGLGAEGALRSRSSPVPGAILDCVMEAMIGEDSPWRESRDALLDRIQAVRVFRFSPSVNERINRFEYETAGFATVAHAARLSDRMRLGSMLQKRFVTLTGPTPLATLLEATRNPGQYPVNSETLPLLLAHAVPLLRKDLDSEELRLQVIADLQHWLDEVDDLRNRWLDDRLRRDQEPTAGIDGIETFRAEQYARYLVDLLTRIFERRLDDPGAPIDAAEVPEPLGFDKAFNEVLLPVGSRLLGRRPGVAVQVALLRMLARIRSARLKSEELVESALFDAASPVEVQLAALEFTRAFLSGLARDEVLIRRGVQVVRNASDSNLTDDVQALAGRDARLRDRIERLLVEPGRSNRVRCAALHALLCCALDRGDIERLSCLPGNAEPWRVEALLRYVIDEKANSAFEHLAAIHARLPTFSESLRALYYQAVAASSHREAPQTLRPEILEGNVQAEEALKGMDVLASLEAIRIERTVKENVRRVQDMDDRRIAALAAANEHQIAALNAATQRDIAQVEATRLSGVHRSLSVRSLLTDADYQIQAADVLRRLNELLDEVPGLDARLAQLQANARAVQRTLQQITSSINEAVAAIEQGEKQEEREAAAVNGLRREASELESRIRSSENGVASARQRLQAARAARASVAPEDTAGARRANERIDDASNEISRLENEVARNRARQGHIPGEVRAHEANASAIRQRVAGLEADVAHSRSQLEAEASRQHRIRQEVRQTELSLEQLRARIRELTATAERLRDAASRSLEAFRDEMSNVSRALGVQVELARRQQHAANSALGEAAASRAEATRLSAEITAVEQHSAGLLADLHRNQDATAEQLRLAHRFGQDREQAGQVQKRARQELNIANDLLVCRLMGVLGLSREARRVLRKVEGP